MQEQEAIAGKIVKELSGTCSIDDRDEQVLAEHTCTCNLHTFFIVLFHVRLVHNI